MLKDELLQKIYSHPKMRKIPVGYYPTIASVIEDILKDMKIGREKVSAKKIEDGGIENE